MLRYFLDLTTWQTTSFLVFSLVRKSNWPGATEEARRMTAPLPKIRTVFVASENGSRLALPSTVRAPFTETGTSSATGCCLTALSEGTGTLAEGRTADSGVAASVSFSLAMGAMKFSLAKEDFAVRGVKTESRANLYIFSLGGGASHSTRVLPWKHWPKGQGVGRADFLAGKRRHEALVDFDLIAGDQLVGFVGHANDGLEFLEHGVGHALAEGGRGVRCDAVVAVVGDADGDVTEFFGKRIERAGRHDSFDAFPSALEERGVVGDGFPEIVDPVGFTGGHDVVVDGADFGACVLVFDEAEGGHEFSRIAASEDGENVSRKWKYVPEGI